MQPTPYLAAAIALVLAASGCLQDPTTEKEDDLAEPATRAADAGPRSDPGLLNWTDSGPGSLALDFRLDPSARIDCVLRAWYDPHASPWGVNAFIAERATNQSSAWMLLGSGWHAAHVHALSADTRGRLAYYHDGGRIEFEWPIEGLSSPIRFTLAFTGLADTGEPNVFLDLRCDGPARVADLHAGRHATVFDARNLHGGVSASAGLIFVEAGVAVQEGLHFASAGPRTQFFLIPRDTHAGLLDLVHPSGKQEYRFTPKIDDWSTTLEWNGGRGPHEVRLTEVDVLHGNLWGALLELHPMGSLAELDRIPASAGDDCLRRSGCR